MKNPLVLIATLHILLQLDIVNCLKGIGNPTFINTPLYATDPPSTSPSFGNQYWSDLNVTRLYRCTYEQFVTWTYPGLQKSILFNFTSDMGTVLGCDGYGNEVASFVFAPPGRYPSTTGDVSLYFFNVSSGNFINETYSWKNGYEQTKPIEVFVDRGRNVATYLVDFNNNFVRCDRTRGCNQISIPTQFIDPSKGGNFQVVAMAKDGNRLAILFHTNDAGALAGSVNTFCFYDLQLSSISDCVNRPRYLNNIDFMPQQWKIVPMQNSSYLILPTYSSQYLYVSLQRPYNERSQWDSSPQSTISFTCASFFCFIIIPNGSQLKIIIAAYVNNELFLKTRYSSPLTTQSQPTVLQGLPRLVNNSLVFFADNDLYTL
jgi:hypothetical protein